MKRKTIPEDCKPAGVSRQEPAQGSAAVVTDLKVYGFSSSQADRLADFFTSNGGRPDPEFTEAFEEACQVADLEREIETHEKFARLARSTQELNNSESRIKELKKDLDILARPRYPQFGTVETPDVEPQAEVLADAQTHKSKLRRETWLPITKPYIAGVMRAGKFTTAKELFNTLEAKAGADSPFEKGTGHNRGSLFVREISRPLSLKTIQNNWAELVLAADGK